MSKWWRGLDVYEVTSELVITVVGQLGARTL
jgi:hypothetical protein